MNDVIEYKSVVVPPGSIREGILSIEQRMHIALRDGEFIEPELPLTHHFAPGAYGREIFLPKNSLVVGKIHKHAHINILSKGDVSVMTEQGPERFSAPRTWVSVPGTKRIVFAHEDSVWTTIHVTNETDLSKIEDFVIAKTYDEYESFRREQLTHLNNEVSK